MKWDNDNQVPVEGTYMPLAIPGEAIMKLFREDWDSEENRCHEDSLWSVVKDCPTLDYLEHGGITLEEFLIRHLYLNKDIEEYAMEILYEILFCAASFMSQERKDRFLDIIGDSTYMWSILDVLPRDEEMNILSRIYFSESDEDVWDILLDGYGDPLYLVRAYSGVPVTTSYGKELFPPARTASPERLRRFLIYIAANCKDYKGLMTNNAKYYV